MSFGQNLIVRDRIVNASGEAEARVQELHGSTARCRQAGALADGGEVLRQPLEDGGGPHGGLGVGAHAAEDEQLALAGHGGAGEGGREGGLGAGHGGQDEPATRTGVEGLPLDPGGGLVEGEDEEEREGEGEGRPGEEEAGVSEDSVPGRGHGAGQGLIWVG